MKNQKPIIKFNGGNPVALCNRCFTIICYVRCTEEDGEYGKVLRQYREELTLPIGSPSPTHCDKCKELLKYTLNE